jgi:hypothetical protein
VVGPLEHKAFGNGTAVKAAAEGVKDESCFDGKEVQRIHVDMECVGSLFGALPHFPGVQVDSLAAYLSWD